MWCSGSACHSVTQPVQWLFPLEQGFIRQGSSWFTQDAYCGAGWQLKAPLCTKSAVRCGGRCGLRAGLEARSLLAQGRLYRDLAQGQGDGVGVAGSCHCCTAAEQPVRCGLSFICMQLTCDMHMLAMAWTCMESELAQLLLRAAC